MGLKIGIPTLDAIPAPVASVSFASFNAISVADPVNKQDGSSKNYVDQAIAAISQNAGSNVISGCGVAWSGTGLQFIVSAGTYTINGVTYSVAQTTVTLAAADPTNPRIDLIIVDNTGTASAITGTPAANPVAPSVDPSTQLQLTFVTVSAGATTPQVTNTLAYDENLGGPTEWNSSSSGTTWALASTNNPYSQTHDIEATAVGTGAYAQLQKPSGTLDPSTQNAVIFFIRSKATFAANRSITITLRNAGTQQGAAISLRDGVYGFSSAVTTAYQQIVIPMSAFAVGNAPINQLRFAVAGSGANIGFYLDLIIFQSGVNAANQNFLVFRGIWASTNAYVRNDVVTDGRGLWICLIANVNSEPNEGNTNWQWLASQSPITRPDYGSFTIPDGGILRQPDTLTLSGSENITLAGAGQLIIDDSLHSFPLRGSFKPGSFSIGSGEWLQLYDHWIIDGNQAVTMHGDSQILLSDFPICRAPLQPIINVYAALGGEIIAETIPISLITTNSVLGQGVNGFVAIWLDAPRVLNGVKWNQVTKGSYTANNNNKVGLYAYSYGNLIQVAQSVNNANLWQTAASDSFGNQNFSAPYTASAGLYFVSYLYNSSAATTAPAIGLAPATGTPNIHAVDFPPGVKLAATASSVVDLPATTTIGSLTITSSRIYLALY